MGSNVEAGKGKVVCVTGASGFIASWLVKLLLLCGYSVRATVRDLNDWSKTEHLLKLEGAKERLNLIKANLLEEGSFDSAVEGCHGVFHTASPVVYGVKDPQTELIDPAVKGTLNVLKSCSKTSSTKRVVLTSSMAAVLCNGKTLSPEVIIDETWFSDPDICKGYGEHWSGYLLSKTLAEKAAWKFTKENNIDMVVLNPAMVIGPILQPTLNSSIDAILILLKASGRYCLAESVKHYSEIVKILHELYPTLQLPDKCEDDETFMPTLYQISKEKAKMLGMEFIPFEVSLKETVESFKEKKFVDF
ncbi:phenylacetaldehyde reductase-like isoform X2 [Prosopis cineraria]|uniref:phenylacetaldehyde reductase-like isoform X2 n=1 Tax=Prosopis cineraria TaxID=364024 RepID=UPI00240FFC66|nr:phenylacetaldehyde reductase-like isoform X2 [Prosopis cineraria]